MHGGGYVAFDKGAPNGPWFRHLAAQGHVVMDIAYRLIPETNVQGMQGDVKRAIAWMKRNAGWYGVNPDLIVLGGESAGSHLALLAGYAPYHPLFTPEDVRGEELSVQGVVGYYNSGDNRLESKPVIERGPIEEATGNLLTSMLEGFSNSKIPSDKEWGARFLGGQPEDWPELYRQVSPIIHVGPNTPPTLQFIGEHDVYASGRGAEYALHRKLRDAGVPTIYVELPRTDHAFDKFFTELSPAARTAMYDVDRFLALIASSHDWRSETVRRTSASR
jgi:acetyl esterase/lipase